MSTMNDECKNSEIQSNMEMKESETFNEMRPTASTSPSLSNASCYNSDAMPLKSEGDKKEDVSGTPTTSKRGRKSPNKSAGRKKTHPVWSFFMDLRDIDGVGSVICLHCDWKTEDRSPNPLRTHLKRVHSKDGIFSQFENMVSQTPTHPYIKKKRGGQNVNLDLSLQNLSEASPIKSNLNFVDKSPRQLSQLFANFAQNSDTMNITNEQLETKSLDEIKNDNATATFSAMLDMALASVVNKENSKVQRNSPKDFKGTSCVTETNALNDQLANLLKSAASNPLVWAMVSGATSMLDSMESEKKSSLKIEPVSESVMKSAFSLCDPEALSVMLQTALDLDLTFSCHDRKGQVEICFESNKTAERSGEREHQIALTENQNEIVVQEKVKGQTTETETWLKTDLTQLMWAIRGKCQKSFT